MLLLSSSLIPAPPFLAILRSSKSVVQLRGLRQNQEAGFLNFSSPHNLLSDLSSSYYDIRYAFQLSVDTNDSLFLVSLFRLIGKRCFNLWTPLVSYRDVRRSSERLVLSLKLSDGFSIFDVFCSFSLTTWVSTKPYVMAPGGRGA